MPYLASEQPIEEQLAGIMQLGHPRNSLISINGTLQGNP